MHEGDQVLDIGAGMGFFTIPLAQMVGKKGQVIAIDVQQKMLAKVKIRAERTGVADRIRLHQAAGEAFVFDKPADFVLAFWMVHEVEKLKQFFSNTLSLLKPGGVFFLAEPLLHVSPSRFEEMINIAIGSGFMVRERPAVSISRAMLFVKK